MLLEGYWENQMIQFYVTNDRNRTISPALVQRHKWRLQYHTKLQNCNIPKGLQNRNMKCYVIFFVFILTFVGITNAAPVIPGALSLVDAAADDIASIAVAKAAAVGFVGGVAINSVSNLVPNVTQIYQSVADGTDVALKSAYKARDNTWEYVKG